MIGKQYLISGRVQGVFYRRFAKRAADELSVVGWARNLADGQVEVHAFGTEEQLTAYLAELQKGPEAADVKDIVVKDIQAEDMHDFEIKEDGKVG